MKKSFAFISLFLLLGVASIFADVTVKKLPDGNAEVYFFYANPRASEVLLAGDFTDWQSGALPMTKTDKGFEITKTFKPTDELRYKFISDGNWTTDLKAPDFVDDGFGGKNSHVVIADMLGGDEGGASKAKINFVSWTMIGAQGNYLTQNNLDKSKKGLDLQSVTFGMKSYNKFVGNFLPNCPVYVEVAMAEKELEDYDGNQAENLNYIYRVDDFGNEKVTWENGLKDFFNGIVARPVEYVARANDNTSASAGPGSNPFLGHLKFGFNTPYINYVTGFNYAKPDVRDAIIWTTVCSSWDAGYSHVGGFNQFSMGDKLVATLEEATGLRFDAGFAPNKTADRKGTKYGYWGWAGLSKGDFAFDFQSNGMYNGLMFDDPVEHDFIIGAKHDGIKIGEAGRLKVAGQALLATHQKDTDDIKALQPADNTFVNDYFGYSTDVWYRSTDFDFLQKIAAQLNVGFKQDFNEYRGKYQDSFSVNASYRLRGVQASMLYVRENHDDGTFDLSSQLGLLNSQNIDVDFAGTVMESALGYTLGISTTLPLSELKAGDAARDVWEGQCPSWWESRKFKDEDEPVFDRKGGAEFTFKPAVTYNIKDLNMTIGAYGDLNLQAYQWSDGNDDDNNKYSSSNSSFRFKKGGLTFALKPEDSAVKGVNVYYGIDWSNRDRMFNTLVGQVQLPLDITANLALGLKTENTASDSDKRKFDSDTNNPFAFAVGVSKKFSAMKKPVLYAQFVYNMDPFQHFGSGQDALNLNRANVNGSWAKEGVGKIAPVDWYDGRAAVRCGIRWDI